MIMFIKLVTKLLTNTHLRNKHSFYLYVKPKKEEKKNPQKKLTNRANYIFSNVTKFEKYTYRLIRINAVDGSICIT
jgi:hypothetical protein